MPMHRQSATRSSVAAYQRALMRHDSLAVLPLGHLLLLLLEPLLNDPNTLLILLPVGLVL